MLSPTTVKFRVQECVLGAHPDFTGFDGMWDQAVRRNNVIVGELIKLRKHYATLGAEHKFRTRAYGNAATMIRKLKIPIVSATQAKRMPSIGKSIGDKIGEILETGAYELPLTPETKQREQVLGLFLSVWGVGAATAKRWYDAGYRTLTDVPTEQLSQQQRVGIEYYDDLQQRIPRSEMDEYNTIIMRAAKRANVTAVITGSYRRGLPNSGDIDVLVEGDSLGELLKALKGILITTPTRGPTKVMGVARLSPTSRVRRIDFHLVPTDEWAAGLLYFTGSKDENLRLRLIAKDLGMKLNEKGLFMDDGTKVHVETEEDIYDALNCTYLPPSRR